MRGLPMSLRQPGTSGAFGATLSGTLVEDTARDTFLVQQMHALAIAIYQAKQRNDRIGVENLLAAFQQLADEYRARGATDMTSFDNFVLSVGNWVETSVDKIPQAIAALPKAVGAGLIQAAIPFIVLYLGFLFVTSRRAGTSGASGAK